MEVEGDDSTCPRGGLERALCRSGSSADQGLAILGKQLWGNARQHPITATNAGRQTVSFRAVDPRLIDKVDTAVIELVGLEAGITERLRTFRSDTITVGRE